MDLCKYKNVLGEPGKGIHSYRIWNIAVVDVIMTIIGALIIKLLFFKNCHYGAVLFWFFFLGIVLHKLFCVDTTINKYLFCKK